MYLSTSALLTATVFTLLHDSPLAAQYAAASEGTVRVGVSMLKPSRFEGKVGAGPVLIGPQSAIDLEWRLVNQTGRPLEIASLEAVLRLRVSADGSEVPVRTEWAQTMTLRSGTPDNRIISTQPTGAITLQDGAAVWVRGATKSLDHSRFAPGTYVLQLDVHGLQQVSASGTVVTPPINAGFPIQLTIARLDSLERLRQFHIVEGAFYKDIDPARSLEHFAALTALPGASWSDWLRLAELYADLGRHREASSLFRKILPDLMSLPDSPLAKEGPLTVHLRIAARSFAVEGDTRTAADLLRREGRTPADRIAAEIEKLRQTTPNAAGNAR